PPTFDPTVAAATDTDANKLLYKNNNAGLINLTPSSSYTCKNTNGELSWNASTKVLTVKCTIFIDGSAKIDNGATNTYTGEAAIDIGTTSVVDGPLDGSTVFLGQSTSSTFSGFTFVPVGMPGNQSVYALPLPSQFTS